MKKTILGMALMAAFGIAKADEGMWTLYNLPQAVTPQPDKAHRLTEN